MNFKFGRKYFRYVVYYGQTGIQGVSGFAGEPGIQGVSGFSGMSTLVIHFGKKFKFGR